MGVGYPHRTLQRRADGAVSRLGPMSPVTVRVTTLVFVPVKFDRYKANSVPRLSTEPEGTPPLTLNVVCCECVEMPPLVELTLPSNLRRGFRDLEFCVIYALGYAQIWCKG